MSDRLPRRMNTPHKTIPPQMQRCLPVDPNRRFTMTGCASAAGILTSLTPRQIEGRDGCWT